MLFLGKKCSRRSPHLHETCVPSTLGLALHKLCATHLLRLRSVSVAARHTHHYIYSTTSRRGTQCSIAGAYSSLLVPIDETLHHHLSSGRRSSPQLVHRLTCPLNPLHLRILRNKRSSGTKSHPPHPTSPLTSILNDHHLRIHTYLSHLSRLSQTPTLHHVLPPRRRGEHPKHLLLLGFVHERGLLQMARHRRHRRRLPHRPLRHLLLCAMPVLWRRVLLRNVLLLQRMLSIAEEEQERWISKTSGISAIRAVSESAAGHVLRGRRLQTGADSHF